MNALTAKTHLDDLLYITSEQILAVKTYEDLMNLYRAGMRRIKTERHLFDGNETDTDLLWDNTLAGFFEYNMRHLPLGPADARQEFAVMGTFINAISNSVYASTLISKMKEYAATLEDSSTFVNLAEVYLRRSGDLSGFSAESSSEMDKLKELKSYAVNECADLYSEIVLHLNRLLSHRAGAILKEVATQLNYGSNLLECFHEGNGVLRQLRRTEMELVDYILVLESGIMPLLKPSSITAPENTPTYPPFISGSLPVLGQDLKSELKHEKLAKQLWDTYRAHVGGTAVDNRILPDWNTFRSDPEKSRQSAGWLKMAEVLLQNASFGSASCLEITPADLANVAISGKEAISFILENEDMALIPEKFPNLRVAVEHVTTGSNGSAFMLYDVEKKHKSFAVVTVSDYSCRFFVVPRDPAWVEFESFGEYVPFGESQKEEEDESADK